MNNQILSKASIVIRSFNEEKHIGKLLTGILNQNLRELEIIIIDSGSTDSTLNIASHFPVRILSITPEEFSFGKSLNIACAESNSEIIIFASAHVYPIYEDWIENLIKPFENKNIALTYGKQNGNNYTKYSEHQIFHKWYPDKKEFMDKHPFCNNANAAIRKFVWDKIPYDESLTGLEDLDWAKRAIDLGYSIKYVPEAEIIHVHDESYMQTFNRYRREAIAFKKIYPDESFGILDYLKLLFTNVFSDYYHSIHDNKFFKNIFSIPVFRFMQFTGTYKGFSHRGQINEKLRNTFYYPRGFSKQNNTTIYKQSKKIDYSKIEK